MNDKQLKLLKSILHKHIEAKKEFEKALEFFSKGSVRDFFKELFHQHEHHAEVLETVLDNEGVTYEIEDTLQGIFHRILLDLRIQIADTEQKAALKSSRSVLKSLEEKYEEADTLNYPDHINNVLVENYYRIKSERQDVEIFLNSRF